MQNNLMSSINITFFILSEHISFLPDNIIKCCEVIHIPRPSASAYNKCIQPTPKKKRILLSEITNSKNLRSDDLVMDHYKIIADKIIYAIMHVEDEFKIVSFRDLLYDILIYNLDINQCVWYIMTTLIESNKIQQTDICDVLLNMYKFFKYYNNNYRPIYHLENFFIYIINIVHGFENNNMLTSI